MQDQGVTVLVPPEVVRENLFQVSPSFGGLLAIFFQWLTEATLDLFLHLHMPSEHVSKFPIFISISVILE